MWKWTGSCRLWHASQKGSHAGSAKSGEPVSCGSDVMLTPRKPMAGDALGLADAGVDAPTPASPASG